MKRVMQEISGMQESTAKAVLAMAVHVMEQTLQCHACPHREECGETVEDCEITILDELMAKVREEGE